ncbi:MAG TPA: hypothetical protein VNL97_08690 [Solirubrobacterales bacterium]|nr:hypothetical protein [Solirubrobacterales bacterium]
MISTYVAALAVCASSFVVGQAAIALCGQLRWSWLSPAVGLSLLCATCWGTVRLPGDGTVSAVAVLLLTVASAAYLRPRLEGGCEALRVGAPVAGLALAAASLPFLVEGHFGILGTSFNPDMSQHLLAADRLADGQGSQLLHQGYPLGPHAIVVALEKGLGIGLVQGFSGLTLAVAVLAPLTALAAFADRPAVFRVSAALVVGLAYMVASYFAQGAFKETMQALFVLAFALSLRETTVDPAWRSLPLRFVPAALLAVGSVYTYSFPGLTWLIGTAAIWAIIEYVRAAHVSPAGGAAGGTTPEEASATGGGGGSPAATGPAAIRPVLLASLLFLVFAGPEISRMIDFHSFETFDPHGPGLGNLFGPISPFEALGIWPSGDFRLSPGDGAVPAFGYYLGAAFASILLLYGAVLCWRRRETALLSGLAAAALIYVAARSSGTPYTAAKAIEVAAPLAALVIVLPLLRRPVAWLYLLAAAGCSVLAFANAPVGPSSYSPALTALRPALGEGPTLVLAPRQLLEDEHGTPYIAWELRGGRVCIKPAEEAGDRPPSGVRFVIAESESRKPPFAGFQLDRVAYPYVLWRRTEPTRGESPCPLIAVRQARQGQK